MRVLAVGLDHHVKCLPPVLRRSIAAGRLVGLAGLRKKRRRLPVLGQLVGHACRVFVSLVFGVLRHRQFDLALGFQLARRLQCWRLATRIVEHLPIVGLLGTGNPLIDMNSFLLPLETAQYMLDMSDRVTEIAVRFAANASEPATLNRLRSSMEEVPGVEVYGGMVVGENQRPGDLDVNICKTKHLTNMRNSIRDIEVRLTPHKDLSLDEAIEYLADDELLEVTPENLRIRKRILDHQERGRLAKRAREDVDGIPQKVISS